MVKRKRFEFSSGGRIGLYAQQNTTKWKPEYLRHRNRAYLRMNCHKLDFPTKSWQKYENSALIRNTGLKLIENSAKFIGVSAESIQEDAKSTEVYAK